MGRASVWRRVVGDALWGHGRHGTLLWYGPNVDALTCAVTRNTRGSRPAVLPD